MPRPPQKQQAFDPRRALVMALRRHKVPRVIAQAIVMDYVLARARAEHWQVEDTAMELQQWDEILYVEYDTKKR